MLAIEVQPVTNRIIIDLHCPAGNQDSRNERCLVARAKSGHEDAFGELYERHRLKVYRTVLRILRNPQDAEDTVQKAFQRALINLESFREDSTFSTWLTRIAINDALMLLRRHRTPAPLHENRVDPAQGDGDAEIVAGGPTPEEILYESERRAALLQAIGRLQKKLRIVVLHQLKGQTVPETARLLGLTVAAAKARIFHARRFLRKHLGRSFKRAGAPNMLQKGEA